MKLFTTTLGRDANNFATHLAGYLDASEVNA